MLLKGDALHRLFYFKDFNCRFRHGGILSGLPRPPAIS
jgi:hypothetical protein